MTNLISGLLTGLVFKKLITENGDKLIILVWHRKEITTSRPDGGNSVLTFLFSDTRA